jgi:hypothetical protein
LRVVLPPGNNGALKASIPLILQKTAKSHFSQKWVTEL